MPEPSGLLVFGLLICAFTISRRFWRENL
ncbi:MAG: PEP-CTERM sorting domain-containing protein [Fimbriimonadales bacterium]